MAWRFDVAWLGTAGDLPPEIDRRELLRAVGKGIAATKRFGKLLLGGAAPAGAAVVRVGVEQRPSPYGETAGLTFTVDGPDGARVETHEAYVLVVGPIADLPQHGAEQALVLADEERYPSLLRARGHEGSLEHPRRARLNPQGALALAACAFLNGQAQGHRNVAAQAEAAAAVATDPAVRRGLRKAIADLRAGVGEVDAAQAAIAAALLEDSPPPGAKDEELEPLRGRLRGLATQRALGADFVPALFALARGIARVGGGNVPDELFQAASALQAAGAEPLLASPEAFQVLLELDGLRDAIGARFGITAAGLVVGLVVVELAAAGRAELPDEPGSLLQGARPLLELALGEPAAERLWRGLRDGETDEVLAPLAARWAARRDVWEGVRQLLEGELDLARKLFERVLKRTPKDGHALVGLAHVHLAAGRADAALATLTRAVDADPADLRARSLLAALLRDLGRPDFDVHLQAALRLDPNDAAALQTRGVARGVAGDVDGARADFARVDALSGPSPGRAYNLGTILLDCKRHEEALPHLHLAASDPHARPEWLVNRGICLRRLGRHREAIRDLTAGHQQNPGLLNALAHRGLCRAASGDVAGGRADLRAYLAANPRGTLADEARAVLGGGG